MKKIFYGIGFLLTVFAVYFSLLCGDKEVYVNNSRVYDIVLSKAISGIELEKIAKQQQVMIQLLEHKNVSFGTTDIVVTLINPDSDIKGGKQKSIFPQNNIVYNIEPKLTDLQLESMTIQTDNFSKIESFCDCLMQEGYECNYYDMGSRAISISMLFNELNLKFFSMILILSLISITMYYIHRLKEIGILRLNGWNAIQISSKILKTMICSTMKISIPLALPFLIYIIIMKKSFVCTYIYIYILIVAFILIVFVLAAVIGTLYIANINRANAIKNGRNNQLIFYSLIFVKIVTTFLVFSEICEIKDNALTLYYTKQGIERVENNNLYKITTSICNEEDEKNISNILESLDDNDIYNLGIDISENVYSEMELKNGRERELVSEENYNTITISENVIERMKIKDASGELLNNMQLAEGEVYYLIPVWMKKYQKSLNELFSIKDESKVIYIESDQTYGHLFLPDIYCHDCIIQVRKTEKKLFPEYSGEVLITPKAAKVFNEKIMEIGLNGYIVKATSWEMDSDLCISNTELDLWESIFRFIIIFLSYIITDISIALIYFEFKKKAIGVYVLLGKIPIKLFVEFFLIVACIVGIGAFATDTILLLFIIIEFVFYWFMAYRYMQKKAINVLKGE